jgi:sugar lactone lactonase YvrE
VGAEKPRNDDGSNSATWLGAPISVTMDAAGNLYVGEEIGCIFKITPDATVTTLIGKPIKDPMKGTTDTRLPASGIAIDAAGNIYTAGGTAVHRMTPAGVVTKIGAEVYFTSLCGIAVSPDGVLYVSDFKNNCIYRGTPTTPPK